MKMRMTAPESQEDGVRWVMLGSSRMAYALRLCEDLVESIPSTCTTELSIT